MIAEPQNESCQGFVCEEKEAQALGQGHGFPEQRRVESEKEAATPLTHLQPPPHHISFDHFPAA